MARSCAPSLFHGCLGPLCPFDGSRSRSFGLLEEAHLSFTEEGAPSGAEGGAAQPGYTYQKRKRGFWKPAPPTRTGHCLAPRRLQVEKSPAGRNGLESFQGRPLSLKFFTTGNFAAGALCAFESRGSAMAREPAHLWRRRGLTLTGCGLALHPYRSALTEPRLNWAGG